ncbi:MAG TPA: 4Fe-4S dicluster domain-containing protein [Candidatus Binatia bacterium]|nr:4Fe-4S dicluster domain-containing protein [Candidatus Binatia bacterium]
MAVGALQVQADSTLLADIRRYGTFDSAACYQCGSCTLSCELVSDSASFPRRSIRMALLGLRGPLLASLEPWVCHDCGDCSTVCPRQAEPRISMATLRRFLTAQYDWSGIASRLLRSKAWYLGSLIFVGVLTFLLILGYHLWKVPMPVSTLATTDLGLEHMFPIIIYYTLIVILVPVALLLSRVYRIWRLTMCRNGDTGIPFSAYAAQAWTYIYESVTQSLMRKCPQKGRWLGHWLLAFGTVVMLAIKTFGLRWFQTDNIYPFYNPQRWVGYLAAAFILYGIGDILAGRWRALKEIYKETKFNDLVFPVLIVLVVLSGLTAHVLRYAGFGLGCHYAYALHVIFATPLLLIEMSFGKWSHMVYRPLALYFLAVKERAAQQAPAPEAVPHAI